MAYTNKANWVGTQNARPMALASRTEGNIPDSMQVEILNVPDGISVTIYEGRIKLAVTMVDSNFLMSNWRNVFHFGVQNTMFISGAQGIGIGQNTKYLTLTSVMPYIKCDSSYRGQGYINMSVSDENRDTLVNVRLNVDGIQPTIKYLQGC